MMDDPAELDRRTAYLVTLRAQGRWARLAGFVLSLTGVMILVIGRYRLGGPTWALVSGVVVIALGWPRWNKGARAPKKGAARGRR